MFDHGTSELNSKYYGDVEKPPLYPLEKIKDFKRIVLVCGKGDTLAEPGDYLRLKNQLESQGSLL